MGTDKAAHLSDGFTLLFPPGAVAAQRCAPGVVEDLLPQEAACLGDSVPERAAEFAAGRQCARRALAELGITDFALVVGADRRPAWPDSIVGSITHTTGLCAAVVGRSSQFVGLGVDSEIVGRVTERLAQRICVPAEIAWLESLPAEQRPAAAALVFAVKEAFYKCQSPLTAQWLNFGDLQVEVEGFDAAVQQGKTGGFRAIPTRTIVLASLTAMPLAGKFRFHEDFVSAGIAIGV